MTPGRGRGSWISRQRCSSPARDRLVRSAKQRELAEVLRACVFEVDADHDLPLAKGGEYARLTRLSVDAAAAASGRAVPEGRTAGNPTEVRGKMTRYDVSNQATIAATPAEIVGAFLARGGWPQPVVAALCADAPAREPSLFPRSGQR